MELTSIGNNFFEIGIRRYLNIESSCFCTGKIKIKVLGLGEIRTIYSSFPIQIRRLRPRNHVRNGSINYVLVKINQFVYFCEVACCKVNIIFHVFRFCWQCYNSIMSFNFCCIAYPLAKHPILCVGIASSVRITKLTATGVESLCGKTGFRFAWSIVI